jgi:hypothetical protein
MYDFILNILDIVAMEFKLVGRVILGYYAVSALDTTQTKTYITHQLV